MEFLLHNLMIQSLYMKEHHLIRVYKVDTSIEQRFIIDSPNIDSSTLRVFVAGTAMMYILEENIQWLIIY